MVDYFLFFLCFFFLIKYFMLFLLFFKETAESKKFLKITNKTASFCIALVASVDKRQQ